MVSGLKGMGVGSMLVVLAFLCSWLISDLVFSLERIGCTGSVTGLEVGLWFMCSSVGVSLCVWW